MAGPARDDAAVRSPFRPAVVRAVALGAGFLLLTAVLFAGVGVLQGGGDAVVEESPAPAPQPAQAPPPAPAPEPVPEEVPEPEPAPASEPTGPDPTDVTVQLLDAQLDDGGAAVARAADALDGFDIIARNRVSAGRAGAYASTTVLYTPGFEDEGRLVAATLGATEVRAVTPENNLSSDVMVHVVVKG